MNVAGRRPYRAASGFSAASRAIAVLVSTVALPRYGTMVTLGRSSSGVDVRLPPEHVQAGAEDIARPQRLGQRTLVDHGAAVRVDQQRGPLHAAELLRPAPSRWRVLGESGMRTLMASVSASSFSKARYSARNSRSTSTAACKGPW